jgi:tetratricopeptide (TPR) repeat protein
MLNSIAGFLTRQQAIPDARDQEITLRSRRPDTQINRLDEVSAITTGRDNARNRFSVSNDRSLSITTPPCTNGAMTRSENFQQSAHLVHQDTPQSIRSTAPVHRLANTEPSDQAHELIQEAKRYNTEGKSELCLTVSERAVTRFPNRADAQALVAWLFLVHGTTAEHAKKYKEALRAVTRIAPNHIIITAVTIKKLLKGNQIDAALDKLRTYPITDDDQMLRSTLLAQTIDQGDYSDINWLNEPVSDTLQRLANHQHATLETKIAAGRYFERRGKHQESISIFTNISETCQVLQHKHKALYSLFFAKLRLEELETSARYLRQLEQELPLGSDTYLAKAQFSKTQGSWQEVYRYASESSRLSPDNPTPIRLTALAANRLKLYKTAEEYCLKFMRLPLHIRTRAGTDEMLFIHSFVLVNLERHHEALSALSQIEQDSPFYDDAKRQAVKVIEAEEYTTYKKRLDLCRTLEYRGSWSELLANLKPMLEQDPSHIEALLLCAKAKAHINQTTESREFLSRAKHQMLVRPYEQIEPSMTDSIDRILSARRAAEQRNALGLLTQSTMFASQGTNLARVF